MAHPSALASATATETATETAQMCAKVPLEELGEEVEEPLLRLPLVKSEMERRWAQASAKAIATGTEAWTRAVALAWAPQ